LQSVVEVVVLATNMANVLDGQVVLAVEPVMQLDLVLRIRLLRVPATVEDLRVQEVKAVDSGVLVAVADHPARAQAVEHRP
jgi:hypothetical protein